MEKPKIMIFCGGSPRHLYVANQLCAHSDPLAIVMETGRRITARKLIDQALNGSLLRKVWRKLRDRPRYAGNREAEFFFPQGAAELTRSDLLIETPYINDPQVLKWVQEYQPDIIAVFGTSLLRGGILEEENIKIVNLHGGLSPWYRGADCTFWALHNGEPENVGCTLHYIDSGIDTGRLIAHISPEIKGSDDELTLFWRAVRDSAKVYGEALAKISDGSVVGQYQENKGRLYQVKDRLWRHEQKLRKMTAEGLLDSAPLPARVKWF